MIIKNLKAYTGSKGTLGILNPLRGSYQFQLRNAAKLMVSADQTANLEFETLSKGCNQLLRNAGKLN